MGIEKHFKYNPESFKYMLLIVVPLQCVSKISARFEFAIESIFTSVGLFVFVFKSNRCGVNVRTERNEHIAQKTYINIHPDLPIFLDTLCSVFICPPRLHSMGDPCRIFRDIADLLG